MCYWNNHLDHLTYSVSQIAVRLCDGIPSAKLLWEAISYVRFGAKINLYDPIRKQGRDVEEARFCIRVRLKRQCVYILVSMSR